MTKACRSCDEWNRGLLHPHCLGFDAPIRMNADWSLTPVRECIAREKMIAQQGQNDGQDAPLANSTGEAP